MMINATEAKTEDESPITKKKNNIQFILDIIDQDNLPDECIEWAYGKERNGYGLVHYAGRCRTANSVALELYSGEAPKGRDSSHLCNNPSCVNPLHLIWESRSENVRRSHSGEQHYANILTDEQVLEIFNDKERSYQTMAEDYGCSKHNIYAIRSGKTWSQLTGGKN